MPRWTAFDAKYFVLSDPPEEVPMTTRESVYLTDLVYAFCRMR